MDDIVPSLLEAIQKDFKKQFQSNHTVSVIWGKIKSKTVTYKDANEFSVAVGEMLAKSYKKFINVDTLPDGKMWYNIATRILGPTFHTNYSLITDVCDEAQKIINESGGVGLGTVLPEFDNETLNGFVNKISNAETFEDVQWMLDEPVVNFSQSIVDNFIMKNAEFQYDSGLTPKIRRTAEPYAEKTATRKNKNGTTYTIHYTVPCEWCKKLEGTYEYPYVPRDVYRRHNKCRCTVEYVELGKYFQNVHEKTWREGEESPAAKQIRLDKLAEQQAKEMKRQAEQNIIRQLMEEHGWDERGATIYYRTHIANKN